MSHRYNTYSATKFVRKSIFKRSPRDVRTTIGYTSVTLSPRHRGIQNRLVRTPQERGNIQVIELLVTFASYFPHRLLPLLAGNQAGILPFEWLFIGNVVDT